MTKKNVLGYSLVALSAGAYIAWLVHMIGLWTLLGLTFCVVTLIALACFVLYLILSD